MLAITVGLACGEPAPAPTPTPAPELVVAATATPTLTPMPRATPILTPTPAQTPMPTSTPTPTATATPTSTPTPVPPTPTPSPTPTSTPTATPASTATPTATATPTPSATPTPTPRSLGSVVAADTECPDGSREGSQCRKVVVTCPDFDEASAQLRLSRPTADFPHKGTIVLTTGGPGTFQYYGSPEDTPGKMVDIFVNDGGRGKVGRSRYLGG